MSATAEHPARILFDSNWVPGLLETLVREEWNKNPNVVVEVEQMFQIYLSKNCTKIVKLVEHLISCEKRNCMPIVIGSGSIDLNGVTEKKPTLTAMLSLQEIYIGSRARSISPLQWLWYLAQRLEEVPDHLLPTFDMVCGSFVAILKIKTSQFKPH